MSDFDVESELTALKAQKRVARKKRYRLSRLDRYHGELMALSHAGATPADPLKSRLNPWLKPCTVAGTLIQ